MISTIPDSRFQIPNLHLRLTYDCSSVSDVGNEEDILDRKNLFQLSIQESWQRMHVTASSYTTYHDLLNGKLWQWMDLLHPFHKTQRCRYNNLVILNKTGEKHGGQKVMDNGSDVCAQHLSLFKTNSYSDHFWLGLTSLFYGFVLVSNNLELWP